MKLSPEEMSFLRHWIYDEAHFREGRGAAKALQLQHGARPADLAALIATAIPDLEEQRDAATRPPVAVVPVWPWTPELLRKRVEEAHAHLCRNARLPARAEASSQGQELNTRH